MESYFTLSDELIFRNIEFIDENGNIVFVYNHKENYSGIGEITDWKQTKLKKLDKNNKYYKISDIKNGFFIGDIEDGIYKDMMVEVFKLNVYSGFLNSIKKDYIVMIIDNPEYDEDSFYNKSRYKMIIFSIIRFGAYRIELQLHDIFTSTI
jgi:hypothetical protein